MASVFSLQERVSSCDLCGNGQFSTVSPEANIVECSRCGYRFVNPRPSQLEIARSYSDPDFYAGWIGDEAGRARMWSARLDLLKRVKRGARVLDIGAGIGTFLAMGRERYGWDVTGTEVSESAARLARKRHGIDLILGKVEDLSLPEHSFDIVTLWHVLEHVPSPSATLTCCHQMLRPNGLLAIAVPNSDDSRQLLVRAKAMVQGKPAPPRYQPLRPHHEVHLSYFSGSVLLTALRTRGFRVEHVTVDNHYANPTARTEALVRVYRAIYGLIRLNLGQATYVLAAAQ